MKRLDEAEREQLIAQFCASLDQLQHDDGDADADAAGEPRVDLHALLAEMAALKNEIRLESRQFKSMLDEMRGFCDVLRQQNERLNRDLERAREQAGAVGRQAERGLLLDMLDLHDRLKAGVDASAARRPGALARLLPGETRFAHSLAQGLALTLQRVNDVLAGYRVRPIDVMGQTLDPQLMQAVGVESVSGAADGQVLRETRRGFFHGGDLLRAAEVIVNKK